MSHFWQKFGSAPEAKPGSKSEESEGLLSSSSHQACAVENMPLFIYICFCQTVLVDARSWFALIID